MGLLNTFGQDISVTGGSIVPSFSALAPVKGEPAVLSSVSGEQNFQTKIQPIIDTANKLVETATKLKAERDAANAQKPPVETTPPDVQAEMDASKTAEQKAYEARLDNYDTEKQNATDIYNNLTLAAKTSAQAQINSLTSQWQQRKALLEQSNRANQANWTQQFIRFGQAEYSPGMTGDFLTLKENEGLQKVKDLDDEYNAKVNDINAALSSNNYKMAAQLSSDLTRIEENALTLMHENAKEANTVNKQIKNRMIQSSRDSAIAGIVSQGISDPAKILELLNYDNAGNSTGGAFTAEEIAKTIKNLTVDGNAKNLPADLKTFEYIRDNYGLPAEITQLPAEQQYFAYLKMLKKSSTTSSDTFTLGTNQVRFDADGNPIAYGPAGKDTTHPNSANMPSWEKYLAAAQKAAGVSYFMAPDIAQLKQQFNDELNLEPLSASEKKKLEQAHLLNATRQEQLDYLYGDNNGGDLPPSLKG